MKGTVITFRVKEEEKERLQAVAKEQDISVSELIRQAVMRHLRLYESWADDLEARIAALEESNAALKKEVRQVNANENH